MSYEPLALKYRPRLFSDMVGQEHVTDGLTAAIEGGRVAHAYLFCGPRGTGKTTTARILARSLNCERGPTPNPCGECAACVAILNGASLDVIELDAASQRKVEDTEDWITTVHLVAAGRNRVYIVDEVHMFSKASFNLLLKTFEEPPEHVVFVLATTEPEKVPATVRGRCQRFDFRLIPHDVLVRRYQDVCAAEGIEPEPGAVDLVARQAAGSARDGFTLLEQALSDDGRRLEVARVRALTGAVDRRLVSEAVEQMVHGEAAGVFALVAGVVDAGGDLRRFGEDLAGYLRGVMVAAAGADAARLLDDVDDVTAAEMRRQGEALGVAGATARLAVLAEALPEVDNETLGRITLEAALVRCCLAASGVRADDLEARVAALEARLATAPPAAAPPVRERPSLPEARPILAPIGANIGRDSEGDPQEPAAREAKEAREPAARETREAPEPPARAAPLPTELAAGWQDVVNALRKGTSTLLQGSRPLALEGATLRVAVDEQFKLKLLSERAPEIDPAVTQTFGTGVRVAFEASDNPASNPSHAATAAVDAEPEPDLQGLTEGPPAGTMSIAELVKQGFGAEIIEEYGNE